jgi:hypothetical protein
VVHADALALEQNAEPSVAEAAPFAGEQAQTCSHRFVTPMIWSSLNRLLRIVRLIVDGLHLQVRERKGRHVNRHNPLPSPA